MTGGVTGPVAGLPVLVGIVGREPVDAALWHAFAAAQRGATAVRVVAAGPASSEDDELLRDAVGRWADKYPDVPVTVDVRRMIDAVVTLVAATRLSAVAVLPHPSGVAAMVVLRELVRRAHCPVVVVEEDPTRMGGTALLAGCAAAIIGADDC